MTGELKSMFDAHLDSSTINNISESLDKQKLDFEENKKKKELYKKQSTQILIFSWNEERIYEVGRWDS